MRHRIGKRLNLILGSSLVLLVIGAALLSFFWLPYDPNSSDWLAQLSPPSPEHWLGTDHLGRDLLARLLVGARGALWVGVVAVGLALVLGSCIGALAGFLGGWVDEVLMRLADALLAFPAILMALLLAAIYKPGTLSAMLAIGLATTPVFARLLRATLLQTKQQLYVSASYALGATPKRVLLRHLLPSSISPIIVQASLSLAVAVLAEAALSFLGLGTPPRVPSWGNMLREAQGFMALNPTPALVPGFAIMITVLGWSLLGDGLRDLLDPRT